MTNETRRRISLTALRKIARRAGRLFRLPARTSVQLVLVNDARMRELNRQALGVDRPTDVLSFPLHARRALGAAARDPDGEVRLGDIVIALDTAQRQAKARGVPLALEIADLFAHGLLHVLGHDHRTKADERRMAGLAARLVEGRLSDSQ